MRLVAGCVRFNDWKLSMIKRMTNHPLISSGWTRGDLACVSLKFCAKKPQINGTRAQYKADKTSVYQSINRFPHLLFMLYFERVPFLIHTSLSI